LFFFITNIAYLKEQKIVSKKINNQDNPQRHIKELALLLAFFYVVSEKISFEDLVTLSMKSVQELQEIIFNLEFPESKNFNYRTGRYNHNIACVRNRINDFINQQKQ